MVIYELMDFSSWQVEEIPVSGANRKLWLVNNQKRGLFKYQRDAYSDYWVESLASDIFFLAGMVCMKADMGIYHGALGCLCYDFTLEHGTFFEMDDELALFPNRKKGCYDLTMLRKVVSPTTFNEIQHMLMIDYLIGNFDRHTRNFGILANGVLAPVYDNGSSLSYRLKPEDIPALYSNKKRFYANAYVNPISRCLKSDGKTVYTNLDLMKVLHATDHRTFKENLDMCCMISEESLSSVMHNFSGVVDNDLLGYIKYVVTHRLNTLKEMT
ncbi:hypothetical protein [Paenibacillus sp. URB8-2]|uniref:hypothetical protein n=1 Tax=Paenibacillus sp. URB8-2 TaxID=2741301 RepID=UPI0015C2A32B|nr:hypothetical protein [Paenibacillus sp. URB8-2]BCG60536.1 hypothetical protein PUR_39610 [Paenibacillus sp. URB8-2]